MAPPLNIAVIGGGISGLIAAYKLRRAGHSVAVFEASSRLGGWVQSQVGAQSVLEWGPNTLMATEAWFRLFRELGLQPQMPRAESRKRFIILKGKLEQLPSGPLSFLMSSVLSWKSKRRILSDFFRADVPREDDLSIEEFALRYLNQEILDRLLQPFISGIYAGDAASLSLRACFPKLWAGLKSKGSILKGMKSQTTQERRPQMVSFTKGLEEIIAALAHELGAIIRREQAVESIREGAGGSWLVKSRFGEESFDQIVLALPAFESARLLQGFMPETQIRFLRSIHYQPIMVWNWVAERLSSFPRGFGCLIPRTEGSAVLGSLWRSEIFEGAVQGQQVTLSQFFSGENLPDDPRTYEQQIRQWIPGIGKTISSEFRVYAKGIPQLRLGHSGHMDEVLRFLPKGVSLIGNYIDGVGLVAVMSRIQSGLVSLFDHFPSND